MIQCLVSFETSNCFFVIVTVNWEKVSDSASSTYYVTDGNVHMAASGDDDTRVISQCKFSHEEETINSLLQTHTNTTIMGKLTGLSWFTISLACRLPPTAEYRNDLHHYLFMFCAHNQTKKNRFIYWWASTSVPFHASFHHSGGLK